MDSGLEGIGSGGGGIDSEKGGPGVSCDRLVQARVKPDLFSSRCPPPTRTVSTETFRKAEGIRYRAPLPSRNPARRSPEKLFGILISESIKFRSDWKLERWEIVGREGKVGSALMGSVARTEENEAAGD